YKDSPQRICGAELVDTLSFVCGERGFGIPKSNYKLVFYITVANTMTHISTQKHTAKVSF
uniref:Insulin-like domain-containing protein n=1 Tax=Leptobrachium leishanense TaxID=445787 RepID=A0A8C5MTT1_9ANUR